MWINKTIHDWLESWFVVLLVSFGFGIVAKLGDSSPRGHFDTFVSVFSSSVGIWAVARLAFVSPTEDYHKAIQIFGVVFGLAVMVWGFATSLITSTSYESFDDPFRLVLEVVPLCICIPLGPIAAGLPNSVEKVSGDLRHEEDTVRFFDWLAQHETGRRDAAFIEHLNAFEDRLDKKIERLVLDGELRINRSVDRKVARILGKGETQTQDPFDLRDST